jgi:hypothetical protein
VQQPATYITKFVPDRVNKTAAALTFLQLFSSSLVSSGSPAASCATPSSPAAVTTPTTKQLF